MLLIIFFLLLLIVNSFKTFSIDKFIYILILIISIYDIIFFFHILYSSKSYIFNSLRTISRFTCFYTQTIIFYHILQCIQSIDVFSHISLPRGIFFYFEGLQIVHLPILLYYIFQFIY